MRGWHVFRGELVGVPGDDNVTAPDPAGGAQMRNRVFQSRKRVGNDEDIDSGPFKIRTLSTRKQK
jgi:hypothetical protein